MAAAGGDSYQALWSDLKTKHMLATQQLLGERAQRAVHEAWLEHQFADLHDILHAQSLLGSMATEVLDFVQGLGEVFSAKLLAAAFASRDLACAHLDAREVLVVRPEELGVAVEWEPSQAKLNAWQAANPAAKRVVVTGFVARNADQRITTLGRNGSDYSVRSSRLCSRPMNCTSGPMSMVS